ncbi:uncharacterized protein LOC122381041 [Amphibalanus amphitrite]|uniref:uncharacterized protein LOC122381041 n=1 Tax=Amphibalanus amphitrite TaxID=1232801 RepID=UPI001C919CA3|nr:uncharacterized protein LOC122381041 [Amphibalanus amphitrite]
MTLCKTPLLPLRVMLFSFYGGVSCVLPFVALHMSTLGLSAAELGWLQTVLPLAGCAGPLLGGALADRLGSYRPLLVGALLLCAAAYPCLMLVPAVQPPPPADAELEALTFLCTDQGGLLAAARCQQPCRLGDPRPRQYYLERCAFTCRPGVPLPSGLPHLCLTSGENTVCELVADVGDGLVVNGSVPRLLEQPDERGQCSYPLVDLARGHQTFDALTCRAPPQCHVSCHARQLSVGAPPLWAAGRCRRPPPDGRLTFWLYFGLRAVTELCLPLALVLVNTSALALCRRHGSDYGWEAACGLLGLVTFAPICGYLIDVHEKLFKYLDFRPSFYVFCALMLICVILASVVPVPPAPTGRRDYLRPLAKSLCNLEFFSVLCVLMLLGTLWGFLEAYLYDHVSALGGSQLQNGLSLAAGTALLLPFLARAEPLINYCGHHHIFIIALIIYIVRYVSYAYILVPWLFLVAESLEMFTVHLAWLAAVLFAASQSRPATEATAQAVITVAHFGVGRGLGAGVALHLLPHYSGEALLCMGSVVAAGGAVLYMLLYYCCRALRPHRPPYGRHKREMYSSNGAMLNGTYAPLKSRHNGV